MKNYILKTLVVIFPMVLGTNLLAQQTQPAQALKAVPVTAGLSILQGDGGNIAVFSGEDGTLLIDDEMATLNQATQETVKAASNKPVRFLINTHWHFDHTGNNEVFGKAGAVIMAHENVRKRMSTEQWVEFLKKKFEPSPKVALPILTFAQGITFHFNHDELQVFHVPSAHTDGDAVIYFTKANVVHAGDIFFSGLYPFIDTASGGSMDGMIQAVDQIVSRINPQTKIIPGHGPLSKLEDLKNYRALLVTVRDRLKKMIQEGKTIDQVIAAKPTAEFDEKWGHGFLKPEDFVRMVYADLNRKK